MRIRPISRVFRRAAVALVAVAVAVPLIALRADAFVYWSMNPVAGNSVIGRASNNGLSVDYAFMSKLTGAQAIAVDSQYIYWANGPSQIGRANLDGTDANPSFVVGIFSANAIAVDPVSGFLFWADLENARIGKAGLADGKIVTTSLISTLNKATGLVVDSTTQTLYWTVNNNAGNGWIGRADENGMNAQPEWIHGLNGAQGLTTDGAYLYWVNGVDQIGRVGLDGSGLNTAYITSARVGTKSGTAQTTPAPLVVGGGFIYYANLFDGYLGQVSNTPGALATNYLHTLLGSATGLAWNALESPGPLPPPTIPDVNLLKADVRRVELPRGIERSLLAQLDAYGVAMKAGDQAAACDRLASYANHVHALAGKKIPQSPADGLLADARMIRETLGCPPTD